MQTKNRGVTLLSLILAIIVSVGLVPQAVAKETTESKSISIARKHLKNEKDLRWEKATVDKVDENKAWVSVAPDQKQFNGGAQFYRIAVDTDEGVATVQNYQVSAPDKDTGISHAKLYTDGELFWSGTVSKEGKVVADNDSPKVNTIRTRGTCEWAVGSLCGTGGSVGCYGACILLGLVSGPGGLGCAAVCGLISSLGCSAATKKICG